MKKRSSSMCRTKKQFTLLCLMIKNTHTHKFREILALSPVNSALPTRVCEHTRFGRNDFTELHEITHPFSSVW
jgi:hypothetical protein